MNEENTYRIAKMKGELLRINDYIKMNEIIYCIARLEKSDEAGYQKAYLANISNPLKTLKIMNFWKFSTFDFIVFDSLSHLNFLTL